MKKELYNRLLTGERLRIQRVRLGMTQDEVSECIGRAPKYYADIERGSCGMSIETLLELSYTLKLSLDYIIKGEAQEIKDTAFNSDMDKLIEMFETCPEKKRKYMLQIVHTFLVACNSK